MPRILFAIPLVLASLQLQGSLLAQEADQTKRLLQIGQFRGLLDATCFYYEAGHLPANAATAYLQKLGRDIDEQFTDGKLSKILRSQVLKQFPPCKDVWPE